MVLSRRKRRGLEHCVQAVVAALIAPVREFGHLRVVLFKRVKPIPTELGPPVERLE